MFVLGRQADAIHSLKGELISGSAVIMAGVSNLVFYAPEILFLVHNHQKQTNSKNNNNNSNNNSVAFFSGRGDNSHRIPPRDSQRREYKERTLISNSAFRNSCVKVEVAVPNKPTVSVDVKQHFDQPSNSQSSGAV